MRNTPGRFPRLALIAAALAALIAALSACGWLAPGYNGINLTGVDWGRDFRLSDADGHAASTDEHTCVNRYASGG